MDIVANKMLSLFFRNREFVISVNVYYVFDCLAFACTLSFWDTTLVPWASLFTFNSHYIIRPWRWWRNNVKLVSRPCQNCAGIVWTLISNARKLHRH